MKDKPSFRDFVRAYRLSNIKEDQLYIFNRETGKRPLYNKPKYKKRRKWNIISRIIIIGLYLSITGPPFILNICGVILWKGVFWDYILIASIIAIPFLILNFRFLYSRIDFKKISETDWDQRRDKEYRKSNFNTDMKIGLVFNTIALFIYLILCFFNSFTITCLRYEISGGLEANASVSVDIDLPEKDIRLKMDTPQGEVFQIIEHEGETVPILIETEGLLEQVKLYINGNNTDYNVGEKYEVFAFNGGFTNHYFEMSIYGDIYFNLPEGENTLELRSPNFSKT